MSKNQVKKITANNKAMRPLNYATEYEDYVYFSCNITASYNKDGDLKKNCKMPTGWSSLTSSMFNSKDNALAIITGERSNIFVIDYDDKDKFIHDSEKYPELLNYYVKTRKGYHSYFQWDKNIQTELTSTSTKFVDFQGNGKVVFAPPTTYKDPNDNVYAYVLMSNNPVTSMTDDLMDYLKSTYLNSTNQNKLIPSKIADALSIKLNQMFNTNDLNWNIERNDENSYKIYHDGSVCLVNPENSHSHKNHSCLFIGQRFATTNCYSDGKKKLKISDYPQLKEIKSLLKLVDVDNKKQTTINDIKAKYADNYNIKFNFKHLLFIVNNINETHDAVAKCLYHIFKDDFVCANEVPKPLWFKFTNGLWQKIDGTGSIRSKINVLVDMLKEYSFILCQNADSNRVDEYFSDYDEEEFNRQIELIEDKITSTEKILSNYPFVTNCILQSMMYFKKENFIEQLDQNRNILCFGENVFDLATCEWRPTKSEDMCSLQCGVTKQQIEDADATDLHNIILDIFPDEDRRRHFINLLTDFLYGFNSKEIFHIWTGTGRNGKGVIATIIKEAFGGYYQDVSISLITGKRSASGQANPELAKVRGKRIVMFSEPEEGSKLNNSVIKEMTGNDAIQARALYEAPITFVPNFTPVIQCNTFNLQDVQDDSIPKRLRFIKFHTSFVEEPTQSWQRKIDESIKSKERIEQLKCAMMALLLTTWEDLHNQFNGNVIHKFKIPQCVLEETNEFLDDNNNVKQFVSENIELTDNESDMLKLRDILKDYKGWCKHNNEPANMKATVLKSRLEKLIPTFKARYRPLVDGKQENLRNVFLKCRYIVSDNSDGAEDNEDGDQSLF